MVGDGASLRAPQQAEMVEFARRLDTLFHHEFDEAAFDTEWGDVDPANALAVFDDGRIVATAAYYDFDWSVPGARVHAGGVTAVGVAPTHRRAGLLRRVMDRQLHDLHERGVPVAALWASEGGIYARFGYGLASRRMRVAIDRAHGALRPDAPSPGQLRLAQPELADALCDAAGVYARTLDQRPGRPMRTDRAWRALAEDRPANRGGFGALQCVLAYAGTAPVGYAAYRSRSSWDDDGVPHGEVAIREVLAETPAAYAALWRFCLGIDLVSAVSAFNLPLDDPIGYLLADPRRARAKVGDGLWVRLVDVPAALAARAYSADVDVVVEVRDEHCPWNAGTWRLRAAGGTGGCERTDGAADLELGVDALGAAYLGGTSLGALAAAGLVRELRPGAVARAAAALSWPVAPHCPAIF